MIMRTWTSPAITGSIIALLGLASTGCVRTSSVAYPKDWSPSAAAEKAKCPNIAGRYVDAGEIADSSTPGHFKTGSRYIYRAEWRSDIMLSHNIANGGSGDWVELRQPDQDTLIMVSSDPTVAVKELHRSHGDFTCSARGLERQLHAGILSRGDNSDQEHPVVAGFNGVEMAYGAMFGTGGMRTLTRSFRPAADGSLVMTVTQSETGLVFLIPYHEKSASFVRWQRSESSPSVAPTVAGEATPVSPYGDIPSAHVALFDSMNGFLHHVRVSNLDGDATNTNLAEDARPIALTPGRHWIEINQIDHHLSPLRDFKTVVGFSMQADAGHRYRLDTRPPACLAPGDVDLALASSRVYHTRVTLLDEARGVATRHLEVAAQCVSGWTRVCSTSELISDESGKGLACVALNGSNYGYYGSDAGPAPLR
jgi:hypothetical protein